MHSKLFGAGLFVILIAVTLYLPQLEANEKLKEKVAINCAAELAFRGRIDDLVSIKNGTYQFAFEEGTEIDLVLSEYSPATGDLFESYIFVGNSEFMDNFESARKEVDGVLQIQLAQLFVSVDKKQLTLRSMPDAYNEFFEMILELEKEFSASEKLHVKAIDFKSQSDDWKELFSTVSRRRFVDKGPFKPIVLMAEGFAARELVVHVAPYSEKIEHIQHTEMVELLMQHLPLSNARRITGVNVYRGLYWLYVNGSYFTLLEAPSPTALLHVLSGLRALGLRRDHPVFNATLTTLNESQ